MSAKPAEEDRDVVPRWRSLANTLANGEFDDPQRELLLTDADEALLDEREAEWNDDHRETTAADFVSTSLVLGVPERAREAIEFLSGSSDHGALRALANAAESRRSKGERQFLMLPGEDEFNSEAAVRRIHMLKQALIRDPRNAVAWMELARNYTGQGQVDHARRAVASALQVGQRNRFILRSATCFYVSIDEAESAHRMLLRSDIDRTDPWLIAAEVSTAEVAGRRSSLAKRGRELLDARQLSPLQTSELASEIGTLELRSGKDKRARRLFERALADPTENSLAQVEWASHKTTGIYVPDNQLADPSAHEARARHAEQIGDWPATVVNARAWLDDQPFSLQAAMLASYGAAVGLENFELSGRLAHRGLQINAADPTLLNNLAYSRIQVGSLGEAATTLARAGTGNTPAEQVALAATWGLLAFREGDVERGREMYAAALSLARRRNLPEQEAMAAVMLAREELALGLDPAEQAFRAALRVAGGVDSAAVREMLKRLDRDRVATRATPSSPPPD